MLAVIAAVGVSATLVPANADRVLTSENMIRNRGFENCTRCYDAAEEIPDRWTGTAAAEGEGVSWSLAAKRRGIAGVRFATDEALPTGIASESFDVLRGATYSGLAWFRGTPASIGSTADLYLEFLDAEGKQTDLGVTSIVLTADWQRVIVRRTPSSAADVVRLVVYGPPGGATFDVDDASLKSYIVTPT